MPRSILTRYRTEGGGKAAAAGLPLDGEPAASLTGRIPRILHPDLSGMIVGTWRVLYEDAGEGGSYCMCLCTRCGVRRIFPAFKLRKGYALRCTECRVRRELAMV